MREPLDVVPPEASPNAAQTIRELTALPLETQETVSEALLPALRLFTQVNSKQRSEEALSASEPIIEKPPEPSDKAILSILGTEYRHAVELLREHNPADYETLMWKLRAGVLEEEHKEGRASA